MGVLNSGAPEASLHENAFISIGQRVRIGADDHGREFDLLLFLIDSPDITVPIQSEVA